VEINLYPKLLSDAMISWDISCNLYQLLVCAKYSLLITEDGFVCSFLAHWFHFT